MAWFGIMSLIETLSPSVTNGANAPEEQSLLSILRTYDENPTDLVHIHHVLEQLVDLWRKNSKTDFFFTQAHPIIQHILATCLQHNDIPIIRTYLNFCETVLSPVSIILDSNDIKMDDFDSLSPSQLDNIHFVADNSSLLLPILTLTVDSPSVIIAQSTLLRILSIVVKLNTLNFSFSLYFTLNTTPTGLNSANTENVVRDQHIQRDENEKNVDKKTRFKFSSPVVFPIQVDSILSSLSIDIVQKFGTVLQSGVLNLNNQREYFFKKIDNNFDFLKFEKYINLFQNNNNNNNVFYYLKEQNINYYLSDNNNNNKDDEPLGAMMYDAVLSFILAVLKHDIPSPHIELFSNGLQKQLKLKQSPNFQNSPNNSQIPSDSNQNEENRSLGQKKTDLTSPAHSTTTTSVPPPLQPHHVLLNSPTPSPANVPNEAPPHDIFSPNGQKLPSISRPYLTAIIMMIHEGIFHTLLSTVLPLYSTILTSHRVLLDEVVNVKEFLREIKQGDEIIVDIINPGEKNNQVLVQLINFLQSSNFDQFDSNELKIQSTQHFDQKLTNFHQKHNTKNVNLFTHLLEESTQSIINNTNPQHVMYLDYNNTVIDKCLDIINAMTVVLTVSPKASLAFLEPLITHTVLSKNTKYGYEPDEHVYDDDHYTLSSDEENGYNSQTASLGLNPPSTLPNSDNIPILSTGEKLGPKKRPIQDLSNSLLQKNAHLAEKTLHLFSCMIQILHQFSDFFFQIGTKYPQILSPLNLQYNNISIHSASHYDIKSGLSKLVNNNTPVNSDFSSLYLPKPYSNSSISLLSHNIRQITTFQYLFTSTLLPFIAQFINAACDPTSLTDHAIVPLVTQNVNHSVQLTMGPFLPVLVQIATNVFFSAKMRFFCLELIHPLITHNYYNIAYLLTLKVPLPTFSLPLGSSISNFGDFLKKEGIIFGEKNIDKIQHFAKIAKKIGENCDDGDYQDDGDGDDSDGDGDDDDEEHQHDSRFDTKTDQGSSTAHIDPSIAAIYWAHLYQHQTYLANDFNAISSDYMDTLVDTFSPFLVNFEVTEILAEQSNNHIADQTNNHIAEQSNHQNNQKKRFLFKTLKSDDKVRLVPLLSYLIATVLDQSNKPYHHFVPALQFEDFFINNNYLFCSTKPDSKKSASSNEKQPISPFSQPKVIKDIYHKIAKLPKHDQFLSRQMFQNVNKSLSFYFTSSIHNDNIITKAWGGVLNTFFTSYRPPQANLLNFSQNPPTNPQHSPNDQQSSQNNAVLPYFHQFKNPEPLSTAQITPLNVVFSQRYNIAHNTTLKQNPMSPFSLMLSSNKSIPGTVGRLGGIGDIARVLLYSLAYVKTPPQQIGRVSKNTQNHAQNRLNSPQTGPTGGNTNQTNPQNKDPQVDTYGNFILQFSQGLNIEKNQIALLSKIFRNGLFSFFLGNQDQNSSPQNRNSSSNSHIDSFTQSKTSSSSPSSLLYPRNVRNLQQDVTFSNGICNHLGHFFTQNRLFSNYLSFLSTFSLFFSLFSTRSDLIPLLFGLEIPLNDVEYSWTTQILLKNGLFDLQQQQAKNLNTFFAKFLLKYPFLTIFGQNCGHHNTSNHHGLNGSVGSPAQFSDYSIKDEYMLQHFHDFFILMGMNSPFDDYHQEGKKDEQIGPNLDKIRNKVENTDSPFEMFQHDLSSFISLEEESTARSNTFTDDIDQTLQGYPLFTIIISQFIFFKNEILHYSKLLEKNLQVEKSEEQNIVNLVKNEQISQLLHLSNKIFSSFLSLFTELSRKSLFFTLFLIDSTSNHRGSLPNFDYSNKNDSKFSKNRPHHPHQPHQPHQPHLLKNDIFSIIFYFISSQRAYILPPTPQPVTTRSNSTQDPEKYGHFDRYPSHPPPFHQTPPSSNKNKPNLPLNQQNEGDVEPTAVMFTPLTYSMMVYFVSVVLDQYNSHCNDFFGLFLDKMTQIGRVKNADKITKKSNDKQNNDGKNDEQISDRKFDTFITNPSLHLNFLKIIFSISNQRRLYTKDVDFSGIDIELIQIFHNIQNNPPNIEAIPHNNSIFKPDLIPTKIYFFYFEQMFQIGHLFLHNIQNSNFETKFDWLVFLSSSLITDPTQALPLHIKPTIANRASILRKNADKLHIGSDTPKRVDRNGISNASNAIHHTASRGDNDNYNNHTGGKFDQNNIHKNIQNNNNNNNNNNTSQQENRLNNNSNYSIKSPQRPLDRVRSPNSIHKTAHNPRSNKSVPNYDPNASKNSSSQHDNHLRSFANLHHNSARNPHDRQHSHSVPIPMRAFDETDYVISDDIMSLGLTIKVLDPPWTVFSANTQSQSILNNLFLSLKNSLHNNNNTNQNDKKKSLYNTILSQNIQETIPFDYNRGNTNQDSSFCDILYDNFPNKGHFGDTFVENSNWSRFHTSQNSNNSPKITPLRPQNILTPLYGHHQFICLMTSVPVQASAISNLIVHEMPSMISQLTVFMALYESYFVTSGEYPRESRGTELNNERKQSIDYGGHRAQNHEDLQAQIEQQCQHINTLEMRIQKLQSEHGGVVGIIDDSGKKCRECLNLKKELKNKIEHNLNLEQLNIESNFNLEQNLHVFERKIETLVAELKNEKKLNISFRNQLGQLSKEFTTMIAHISSNINITTHGPGTEQNNIEQGNSSTQNNPNVLTKIEKKMLEFQYKIDILTDTLTQIAGKDKIVTDDPSKTQLSQSTPSEEVGKDRNINDTEIDHKGQENQLNSLTPSEIQQLMKDREDLYVLYNNLLQQCSNNAETARQMEEKINNYEKNEEAFKQNQNNVKKDAEERIEQNNQYFQANLDSSMQQYDSLANQYNSLLTTYNTLLYNFEQYQLAQHQKEHINAVENTTTNNHNVVNPDSNQYQDQIGQNSPNYPSNTLNNSLAYHHEQQFSTNIVPAEAINNNGHEVYHDPPQVDPQHLDQNQNGSVEKQSKNNDKIDNSPAQINTSIGNPTQTSSILPNSPNQNSPNPITTEQTPQKTIASLLHEQKIDLFDDFINEQARLFLPPIDLLAGRQKKLEKDKFEETHAQKQSRVLWDPQKPTNIDYKSVLDEVDDLLDQAAAMNTFDHPFPPGKPPQQQLQQQPQQPPPPQTPPPNAAMDVRTKQNFEPNKQNAQNTTPNSTQAATQNKETLNKPKLGQTPVQGMTGFVYTPHPELTKILEASRAHSGPTQGITLFDRIPPPGVFKITDEMIARFRAQDEAIDFEISQPDFGTLTITDVHDFYPNTSINHDKIPQKDQNGNINNNNNNHFAKIPNIDFAKVMQEVEDITDMVYEQNKLENVIITNNTAISHSQKNNQQTPNLSNLNDISQNSQTSLSGQQHQSQSGSNLPPAVSVNNIDQNNTQTHLHGMHKNVTMTTTVQSGRLENNAQNNPQNELEDNNSTSQNNFNYQNVNTSVDNHNNMDSLGQYNNPYSFDDDSMGLGGYFTDEQ